MFGQEALAGYLGTAIWTLINLFVIYLFMRRFLFKPFAKVIEKRQQLIASQLDEAKAKSEQAKAHEEETAKRLQDSVRKATDIVNEARQKAQTQEAAILKDATEEAQAILDRSAEESKRIRSNMYADMRKEIADLSVAIASKVIGSTVTKQQQYQMVDRFLDDEVKKRASQVKGVAEENE